MASQSACDSVLLGIDSQGEGMSKDLSASGLSPPLLSWVATTLGGEVAACERITGGASRLSYVLGVERPARVGEAFLRVDSGSGPLSGTIFTLQREVAVMIALEGTEVRVPEIYGFAAPHSAVLMQKVAGTSNFFGVTDGAQAAELQDDLLRQLSFLHQVPLDARRVFGDAAPGTVRETLREDVKFWGELFRKHVAHPEPVLTYALDWLHRNALGGDRAPVLVHGDIGPGNFLFDGPRVTALIDWELTHAGHPLEDLSCIIARTLGVPFGDLRRHIATYGRLTGKAVDPNELDYCLVLVLTRWCIAISMGLAKVSVALDLPILVKFLQVNLFALVKIMARLSGQPFPKMPEGAVQARGLTALYDYTSAVLDAQIKPAVNEPYLKARVDGLTGMLTYLRNVADYGSDRLRAEELAALRIVLGDNVESAEAGRVALAVALRGAADQQRARILEWLLKRSALQQVLMKPMLGPMYDRELDYH
jgi:aminoglycoside phosphotransferase (APT) family kinase protein